MTSTSRLRASRFILASLLPALLAGGAMAQEAGLQPVDRIAAVVNEDVILRNELDRAVANIRAQYADRANQLPPTDVLERQVLERLVLLRLQIARATDSGINATDEDLERAVQGVAQQNGMTTDQLRSRLAQDGLSFTDFRNSLREEIITQKLRQSFAQGRINVSEAEVDAALAGASANAGQQYHLAHILVGTPDGASPEQIATALKKIEGVKSLIDRGEMNFAAAAVRYSDSPNALEGGDLGWRSLSEIPAAFASAIQQLQTGEVLGPIRAGQNQRAAAVGDEAAHQHAIRPGDHRRVQHVVDGDRILEAGARILCGPLTLDDRHHGQVFLGHAVGLHVAKHRHREHRRRADRAERHFELAHQTRGRARETAGADPGTARFAVGDQDRLRMARRDRRRRVANVQHERAAAH